MHGIATLAEVAVGVEREAECRRRPHGRCGQKITIDAAVAAALLDPQVAGAQGVAQLDEDAQLVGPPIDTTVAEDTLGPPAADEPGRGVIGHAALAPGVQPAQQLDALQQGLGRRRAPEPECLQEARRVAADLWVGAQQDIEVIDGDGAGESGRVPHPSLEGRPGEHVLQGLEGIPAGSTRLDERAADLGEEAQGFGDAAPLPAQAFVPPPLGRSEEPPDDPVMALQRRIDERGAPFDEAGGEDGEAPIRRQLFSPSA